jgi:hypothetical protein
MSEQAPITSHEAFNPARTLELVEGVEDPTTLRPEEMIEESSRFQDVDEAHELANMVNIKKDMITEARAALDKAYATKNSPLVEKLEQRVKHGEIGLTAELTTIPRAQRQRRANAAQRRADDYDQAA